VSLRQATRRLGRTPESFAIAARHQGILAGNVAFELALERSTRVPMALKELASVKAASVAGCAFCLDIGSWLARTHGVTEEQLRELSDHRESAAFSDVEKLVLDYADAMSRAPVEVSDGLFAALRSHFDERQLVELTGAIAWENHRARFNAALDVGAQGFSEGAVCAAPAAAAASAA
jgi:4-carboxymuconolactone decarboxylase